MMYVVDVLMVSMEIQLNFQDFCLLNCNHVPLFFFLFFSFLIMFCLVAYLYKTEEVLGLIWSSGLIIMIRGKRAI